MTTKHRQHARNRRPHQVLRPTTRPAATAPEPATPVPTPRPPQTRPRTVQAYRPDPDRCAVAYVCTWKPVLERDDDGKRLWRSFLPTAFDQHFADEQMIANMCAKLGKPIDLPPVYVGHGNPDRYPSWTEPVGKWVEFRKDSHGLAGVAEFDNTDAGILALQMVWAKGFPGWSGQFGIYEERDAGMGKLVLPAVEVTSSALVHAGPVSNPADTGAVTIYARGEYMVRWNSYPGAHELVADLLNWPALRH